MHLIIDHSLYTNQQIVDAAEQTVSGRRQLSADQCSQSTRRRAAPPSGGGHGGALLRDTNPPIVDAAEKTVSGRRQLSAEQCIRKNTKSHFLTFPHSVTMHVDLHPYGTIMSCTPTLVVIIQFGNLQIRYDTIPTVLVGDSPLQI